MKATRSSLIALFLIIIAQSLSAQLVHVGLVGGASTYIGDINDKIIPKGKQIKGAIGITFNYELYNQLILRAGFIHMNVAGADSLSSSSNRKLRNLSFQSSIDEISFVSEFYLFNLYARSYSPYFFGGLALFHFNPYAYTMNGEKVFLQPLSTEGQGIQGYPRRPYKLMQFAIPLGAGIKFAISEKIRLGFEVEMRKLFTDYLDDVSTTYADVGDLYSAKGYLAVDMAFRGDEVGNPVYPSKGEQRGGERFKDMYYTVGAHLTYRISSMSGDFHGRYNNKLACPSIHY